VTKAETLFCLLPSPHAASDWCLENGHPICAAWLAQKSKLPPTETKDSGSGSGSGMGNGSGWGNGNGSGRGSGRGRGSGMGNGNGNGRGWGMGNGSGWGNGNGNGRGWGWGSGMGNGSGWGNGRVSGMGNGNGNGRGHNDITSEIELALRWDVMHEIGEYVLVRDDQDGILVGEFQGMNGTVVYLKNFRKVWEWQDGRLSPEDVAMIPNSKNRLSVINPGKKTCCTVCGIAQCSPEVEAYFRTAPADDVNKSNQ
jgi:hypothetical protein